MEEGHSLHCFLGGFAFCFPLTPPAECMFMKRRVMHLNLATRCECKWTMVQINYCMQTRHIKLFLTLICLSSS